MTDSVKPRQRAAAKRERLATAAMRVLWEQGVERTTLADIAKAAEVPTGNVYYYFKTKDELVQAALDQQEAFFDRLSARLEKTTDPRQRLKGLVESWVKGRVQAARYGCPTGTLAAELDKRGDGVLDAAVGTVFRRLLDWAEQQFRALGLAEPADLAVTLVAGYQGMTLLASALRDPDIMVKEGERLLRWLDSLEPA